MRSIIKLLLPLLFVFPSRAQNFTNVIVDNTASDGECTVLINPSDQQNVIASRNGDLLFRSFDGGLTWQDTNMSIFSSQNIIGDVALAADNNGKLFFQALDNQYLFRQFVSNNGGVTWNTETVFGDAGYIEDKNWLTCDRVTGSSYAGRVYCAWTRRSNGSGDPGYIFLNHTPDGGVSWSARETLDVVMNSSVPPIGTGLACGPGGSINVTWGGGTPNRIYFKKSTDGGLTWAATPVIVDNNVQPVANYYASISHPINFSAQFTSLACDVSGGTHNGNLYCVWDDIRNGANNADIFLARSTDGGTTWATQRINDDVSTRNQVVPTVAVDPQSGWVYVAYLDARTNNGSGPDDSLHYYLAFSGDGGQTFTNVRVSQQLSTTTYIHSDYMGLDAINGNIGCLWVGGQLQSGSNKMWYAPIQQSQLVGVTEQQPATPPLLLYPAIPNPAIDFTAFDFQLAEPDNVTLTITDINGRNITTLLNKAMYTNGRHQVRMQHSEYQLAAGMYVATITTGKHTASRKFTVYK